MAENVLAECCEGNCILFLRGDSPGGRIHYRMKIPGTDGYERRSTGHKELVAAKRVVDARYRKLTYETEALGRTALPQSFRIVATAYVAYLEKQITAGRVSNDRLVTHRSIINSRLIPHLGDIEVDAFTERHLFEYKGWRITIPRKRGKSAQAGAPPVSDNTITGELSVLRCVLAYAVQCGDLDREKIPKHGWGTFNPNPRPAFTEEQMLVIEAKLYEWIKDAEQGRGQDYRLQYRRRRLQAYVMTLGYTGMRPKEAKKLKWGQCRQLDYKYELAVSSKKGPKAKERKRDVQALPKADHALKEWRAFQQQFFGRNNLLDTDFVFCDYDKAQFITHETTLKNFLKFTGITHDPYSEPYVCYSLRHYFATSRLEEGISQYLVAQAMGTSVEQIENYYGHVKSHALRKELERGTENKSWVKIKKMVEEATGEPLVDVPKDYAKKH